MEVLLYLIKSQEIDIFDIPIAKITDQYLAFLELMRDENLDVAGEYLVMAATLIQIKSKMILPIDFDDDEDDVEDEDPRLELVEKLIAYRQYRELTGHLDEMAEERQNWFARRAKPDVEAADDEEDDYIEVSLYDLIGAFKNVLRFMREDVSHTVSLEESSVDVKIEYIQGALDRSESVAWIELFKECRSKVELVCCFLAILEMCRMGLVSAHQHRVFGDIRLFKKMPESNVA